MSQGAILPHIYYTVTELASITDIKALKNLNVKTIGFIHDERAYEISFKNSTIEDSDMSIQLDLSHTSNVNPGMKPYLIFGLLYFVNQAPALSVKSLKQFDADFENLIVYHHQLLAVRKKSAYFEDLGVKK